MFTEYQELNTEQERYIPFSHATLTYIDLALRDVCVCVHTHPLTHPCFVLAFVHAFLFLQFSGLINLCKYIPTLCTKSRLHTFTLQSYIDLTPVKGCTRVHDHTPHFYTHPLTQPVSPYLFNICFWMFERLPNPCI